MNLALCCDVRLAGASARFDTRFLQLGLHPGGGHTWMMRRIAGPAGHRGRGAVRRGARRRGGGAGRAGVALRRRRPAARHGARDGRPRRGRAAGPLARRIKATIATMADVATHDAAVDVELEAQVWSMDQPEFAERLAAVQDRISSR